MEISPTLIHSSDLCKREGWNRLKPGTGRVTQVSHTGAGPKHLDPFSVALPGPTQGAVLIPTHR